METVELRNDDLETLSIVKPDPQAWTYPGYETYFAVYEIRAAKPGSKDMKGRLPSDGYRFQEFSAGWTGQSSAPHENQPMTWTVTFGTDKPVAGDSLSTAWENSAMPIVVAVSVPIAAKPLNKVPVFTLLEAGVPVFRMRLDTGKTAPLT